MCGEPCSVPVRVDRSHGSSSCRSTLGPRPSATEPRPRRRPSGYQGRGGSPLKTSLSTWTDNPTTSTLRDTVTLDVLDKIGAVGGPFVENGVIRQLDPEPESMIVEAGDPRERRLHECWAARTIRTVARILQRRSCAVGAGSSGFPMHQCPHTIARRWLERGGSLAALQELLGHASIVTTQRFARLSENLVHREAERLGAGQNGTNGSQNRGQGGLNRSGSSQNGAICSRLATAYERRGCSSGG